ncbi:MAG: glycosyl hydrolase [Peptoniphilus sp.]|uniref:glycoside hydrolase family 26 protein n=1 Tax=Peptoniphilus sp. TaxID=1971214 RepID=UPI002A75879A|nr:glycosyl hydrolase [Peptoniphilus sp.]MDY2986879.1 glycosyl hydrolase [Peptoniphilus sp.]
MNKIITKIILIVFIFMLIPTKIFASNFDTEKINDHTKWLKNYQDGYRIQVPANSEIEMKTNLLSTEINFFDINMKIFIQDLNKDFNYETYEYYSLRGIRNTKEHKVSFDGKVSTKFGNIHKIKFTRQHLSEVENDKPNYMILFKNLGEKALTVMIKSSTPINEKLVMPMVESIKFDIAKNPKTPEKVPNSMKDGNFDRLLDKKTLELYQKDFNSEHPTTWGLYSVDFWRFTDTTIVESEIGHKFKYALVYHDFSFPNSQVKDALDVAMIQEKTVELTFQSQIVDGENQTYDVLDGKYEDYFRELARMIKVKKLPILFRIGNEMNGDWCAYSAYNTGLDSDIYREFYNYIYKIFEEEGANSYILYVFNPNGRNFPNFKYNDGSEYRPSADKYDIVGMTLYNTGNYYSFEKWETFDELYTPLYKKMVNSYDKPLMITEFSSSTVGGDKVKWTRDMFESLKKFDKIKVAIWFSGTDLDENKNPARIYKIDEPKEVLQVFKENLPKNR